MIEKIKQIWKDSVLSKVISVGIVWLISLMYNFISSKIADTTFRDEFIKFWTLKIDLWQIVSFIGLVSLIYLLFRQFNSFKYDSETLKLDRALFTEIREKYLTEEIMLVPKGNGFSSNAFYGKILFKILDITEVSQKANFEFLNPVLEKKKNELLDEIDKLYSVTSKYIFRTNNIEYLSIPREWSHNDSELFDEAQKNISQQENKLTEKYEDFIKTGRRILKI